MYIGANTLHRAFNESSGIFRIFGGGVGRRRRDGTKGRSRRSGGKYTKVDK